MRANRMNKIREALGNSKRFAVWMKNRAILTDEVDQEKSADVVIQNTTKAIAEIDRIESEKPDVCKTDCEFYKGCLETFTHKKSEKPHSRSEFRRLEIQRESENQWDDANVDACITVRNIRINGLEHGIKLLQQFAERYYQSRTGEK